MPNNSPIRYAPSLIATGAPKPLASSPLWNEWAANNPQPEAIALGKLDIVDPMMQSMKAIATGARPYVSFNYDAEVM